jgi:hypothetical protein
VTWRDYFGKQRRDTLKEADEKIRKANSQWDRFLERQRKLGMPDQAIEAPEQEEESDDGLRHPP